MQERFRKQIDWPQAFPPEEHAARRAQVRKALQAAGLDAIYVTIPADLTWLSGYDMIWYHYRTLTGLLVRADRDETVLFDSGGHKTLVYMTPEIGEVVWFDPNPVASGGQGNMIATELAKRGLGRGKIAIQPWGYSPHATVMDAFAARLREGGATVSDGSRLVEELRLVKSPREVAVVRQAAQFADQAMSAAREAIKAGVMETELEGVIMHSLMRNGCQYPSIRSMIGSGPRSGTHHSAPSQRKIRQGDLVFIDFCAVLHRYHVNLNRTFSLGKPDPRWTELMDKSAGCAEAVVREVKPGDPWTKVQKVADRYIEAAGIGKWVWWVGGYALSQSVPPDWVGTHFVDPHDGIADRPLVPGMVFNLENQFDVWEDWPGGTGAAYIESFLMTDKGLEILSKLPRNLAVV